MKSALLSATAAAIVLAFAGAGPAHAVSSLTLTTYTMAVNNPDVEHGIDGGVVTGLVNSTLTGGLPTVSAFGKIYGGPSGPITDVNFLGQLQWWTPGLYTSGPTSVSTVPLPYDSGSGFFPIVGVITAPNNGAPYGYMSATLAGSFSIPTPGSITINLGSDDDAWVFIDGVLQVDNGGVHADLVAPTTTDALSAGSHSIDVFFADRHTVEAQLTFNADVTFTPVPEPMTLAIMGTGLLGLGLIRRRRTQDRFGRG